MRIIVTFFLFFSLFSHAVTYPISPRPLRMLVKEAKHIIVGHVLKIEKITKKIDRKRTDTETFAVIAVNERLQGEVREDTIKVAFEPNMICPAPAMYFENTDVLAFLDGEKGNYYTHALSYGAKTLDTLSLSIYKERIWEMQIILANTDSVGQLRETIEWLVRCAENEETSWEGTFELSPQSDFISYYLRQEIPNYALLLSDEQKQRLKEALLKSAEKSSLNLALADLVYLGNEDEVDKLLIKDLKLLVNTEVNWLAEGHMKRLVHLNYSDETNRLIKEFNDVMMDYENKNDKKATEIVLKFIALIENPKN